MGELRLVASYFDRNEAWIAAGALDAAGVPAFLHTEAMLSINPFHEIGYGGYRLMVVDTDLGDALHVLAEARRAAVHEGEYLVTHTSLLGGLFSLALFLFIVGLPLPLRRHEWRDEPPPPKDTPWP